MCFVLVFPVFSQSSRKVSGTVKAPEGEPLPGVLIKIKGTDKATQTDFDGNFKISVKNGDVLVVSYMGMKTTIQEVVSGKDVYNVVLFLSAESLDDIVVTAYGSSGKVNIATTSTTVKATAIENRPVASLGEALQGLAPSLVITPNAANGGVPGASANIAIRGASSINGGSTPLILVDGIEMSINALDPNDIESVTVLADIASSAIYGARGSRGVILIKTKSGAGTVPSVTIRNNVVYQRMMNLRKPLGTVAFAKAYNDVAKNDGVSPWFTDDDIAKFKKYAKKTTADPAWDKDENGWLSHAIHSGGQELYSNLDHVREIFKIGSLRYQKNISVSGGILYGKNKDKKVSYKLAGNFFNQGSAIRKRFQNTEDYYYSRRTMTLSLRAKPIKWATFGVKTNYANLENAEPLYSQNGVRGGFATGYNALFHDLSKRAPYIAMLFDGPGNKPTWYHGSFATNLSKSVGVDDKLNTVVEAVLEPIKNWKTTIRYRHRITHYKQEGYIKKTYRYNISTKKLVERTGATVAGGYRKYMNRREYNSPQIFSQYEPNLGKDHYLKLLAGAEQEYSHYETLTGLKYQGISDNIQSVNTSTGDKDLFESKSHWATRGFFGGLNYTYGKRYVLNATIRRDGSSRFAKGRQWGTFYSYALAYNVNNEPALKDILKNANIDKLKLKFSSGQIGNQSISLYQYTQTLPIRQNNSWLQGGERDLYTYAPGLINDELTWETKTDMNFGIELTAFNKRLYTDFVYYNVTTRDMIGPAAPLPSTLGTSNVRQNNAEMQANGFEATVTWQDKIGEVNYKINANIGDFTYEITKYYNPKKLLNTFFVGMRPGDIWGYETVGIMDVATAAKVQANSASADTKATDGYANQRFINANWSAGDIRYKDLNGDGKINEGESTLDNPGDRKVIGNTNPRYRYSVDTNISWKGFGLRLFFQGVGKRDIDIGGNGMGLRGFHDANIFQYMLDYWREDNKDAFYPKPYFSTDKNRKTQSKYIVSAAYLRLKNISFSYALQKGVLDKLGIKAASIYFSADNIFTITSEALPDSIDPELRVLNDYGSAGATHPLFRTFSLGFNLSI